MISTVQCQESNFYKKKKKSDDFERGFCLPACSLVSLSIIAQVAFLLASTTFQGRGFRLPGNGGERQLSWISDVVRLSSVEQAVRQLLLRVIMTCGATCTWGGQGRLSAKGIGYLIILPGGHVGILFVSLSFVGRTM